MNEYWEQVPIVGDLIREKTQEAQALILQENIMDFLAARFGVANGKAARMINSIDDPRKLKVIYQRALQAKSLDTVVTMLQKAKSTVKRKTVKA